VNHRVLHFLPAAPKESFGAMKSISIYTTEIFPEDGSLYYPSQVIESSGIVSCPGLRNLAFVKQFPETFTCLSTSFVPKVEDITSTFERFVMSVTSGRSSISRMTNKLPGDFRVMRSQFL
jgi:hypothetical protein